MSWCVLIHTFARLPVWLLCDNHEKYCLCAGSVSVSMEDFQQPAKWHLCGDRVFRQCLQLWPGA